MQLKWKLPSSFINSLYLWIGVSTLSVFRLHISIKSHSRCFQAFHFLRLEYYYHSIFITSCVILKRSSHFQFLKITTTISPQKFSNTVQVRVDLKSNMFRKKTRSNLCSSLKYCPVRMQDFPPLPYTILNWKRQQTVYQDII